jgi:hypothetical protein
VFSDSEKNQEIKSLFLYIGQLSVSLFVFLSIVRLSVCLSQSLSVSLCLSFFLLFVRPSVRPPVRLSFFCLYICLSFVCPSFFFHSFFFPSQISCFNGKFINFLVPEIRDENQNFFKVPESRCQEPLGNCFHENFGNWRDMTEKLWCLVRRLTRSLDGYIPKGRG